MKFFRNLTKELINNLASSRWQEQQWLLSIKKSGRHFKIGVRNSVLKRIGATRKHKEMEQDNKLKEKQVSAAIQIKGLVSRIHGNLEFSSKRGSVSSNTSKSKWIIFDSNYKLSQKSERRQYQKVKGNNVKPTEGQTSAAEINTHATKHTFQKTSPANKEKTSSTMIPNVNYHQQKPTGDEMYSKIRGGIWKEFFPNLKIFREEWTIKCFALSKNHQAFTPKTNSLTLEAQEDYTDVNNFCWNIRENLRTFFEAKIGIKRALNLSNREKAALQMLKINRNKSVVIDNTDKNVGPETPDVKQVIEESKRQLYDKEVFYFLQKNKWKNWFKK